MDTPVLQILRAAGVPHQVRLHTRPVFTVEEAAQERGVRTDQIVKVMVCRSAQHFLVALVPGDRKLDLRRLARLVGVHGLSLATREESARASGYPLGAISPVGLPAALPLWIDRAIAEKEQVAISAGDPSAGVVLAAADLLHLLSGTLADLT